MGTPNIFKPVKYKEKEKEILMDVLYDTFDVPASQKVELGATAQERGNKQNGLKLNIKRS